MKKNLLTVLAVILISNLVIAQENTEEVDMLQALYGMHKKQLVTESLDIPEEQEVAFWLLYDEYESKRKALGKQRIEIIEQYANEYFNLDGDVLNTMLSESMKLNMDYNKLINTYTKKIAKTVAVKSAGQFYQLEGFLMSLIRLELMHSVPFIGEIKKLE